MAHLRTNPFTPEEYITQDKALHKSEYLSGQIFAMSGARIVLSQMFNRLYNQIAHSSDMRVQASPVAYFYPDVVCCLRFALRMMSSIHF